VHELLESSPTSTLALQVPVSTTLVQRLHEPMLTSVSRHQVLDSTTLVHELVATSVQEYPVWCIIQHYCCITKSWWCTGTRDGEPIRFKGQCVEYIDPKSLKSWVHNSTTDSMVGYGSIINTIRHESLSWILED
jgi:hypothetical protein